MILVVGSSKGGVSKSTHACNLAAALANAGNSVCLVGADKDVRTTVRWATDRAATDLPKIALVEQLGDLHELLLKLDKEFGYVIVDPAGRDSRELRTALAVANVAIVPFQPSQVDVDTMEDLEPVLDAALKLNAEIHAKLKRTSRSLRLYALITRASTNAKSTKAEQAREFLAGYKQFTVLQTITHDREIYRECMSQGMGVMEVHRRPSESRDKQLATAEIEAILTEIFQ